MTVIVNPLHWYHRPAHLEHVTREMRRRGAPRIRAYFDGEVWHCKEGTHRLRAALALNVAPVMVPIPWWRSKASLERARYAAICNGHAFPKVEVSPMTHDLSLCAPVTDEPRRGDFWLLGDGNTQTWRPGDRGAPAGKWHEKADVLMRPPNPYGDPTDYATPEMVAAREHPDAEVCADPECRLSGGFAHVGDCTLCGCEKRHAAEECPR